MDYKENELKELLERFCPTKEAEQMIHDFVQAEGVINQSPAPLPDEESIKKIKADITRILLQKKKYEASKQLLYKAASVAALLAVAAIAGVLFFKKSAPLTPPMIADTVWESDDISVDDSELATLYAEIEQTESELLAIRMNERDSTNGAAVTAVTDLEMELIETGNDFWKG